MKQPDLAIWKYPLEVADEQTVNLPNGAQVLCVQNQNEVPCIWAKVDTQAVTRPWRVVTRGTGHAAGEWDGSYVGTYQMLSGGLVFHVFMSPR